MYTLMPFTPIKAVLRLANPVKLLKGVADIFLTKMLGKNLAQRMIAEVYIKDPAMTEQGIKELRNAIRNKQVCDRIAQYVSHPDTELPSADSDKSAVLAMVLCVPRFEPPLQAQSILRSLDDAQIHSLHTLLLAEIRQADMRKLVEFYGNDEVIAILKELVSVFYVPLVELYQTADLPSLISDVKDILSSILTVAEQRTTDPKELIAQYVESLKGATERLYRFFHTAASNDSGTMEGLMSWFLSLVELARRYGYQLLINQASNQAISAITHNCTRTLTETLVHRMRSQSRRSCLAPRPSNGKPSCKTPRASRSGSSSASSATNAASSTS